MPPSCACHERMTKFRASLMKQKCSTHSRVAALARALLAILLLAAFVCVAVPLASVSAGNECRLECCAARAPHAAGSCMNGTCHAAIQIHQIKLRRSSEVAPAEEFCGLKRLSKQFGYHAISADGPTTQNSVATFGRPCKADCGSCAIGSLSAKGKIAIAAAYRLQLLGTKWSIDSERIPLVEAFHDQYSPRGPPGNPI
jgi:hypothetical protein